MTTKKVKAKRLTTRDKLVVEGKVRREALPIAEVGMANGRVDVTIRRGVHIERRNFSADDLVRVKS
jgi:hypothetical protein